MCEHPNTLIIRADKVIRNELTVMNSMSYNKKMHKNLSDNNTYININKDPINIMTKQTHTLLIRWKKKRIRKSEYVQEIKCFGTVQCRNPMGCQRFTKKGIY